MAAHFATAATYMGRRQLKAFDRLEIATDIDNADNTGDEAARRIGMGWHITGVCEHPERPQKRCMISFDAWSDNSFRAEPPRDRTEYNSDELVAHEHFGVYTFKDALLEERIGYCKVKSTYPEDGILFIDRRNSSGGASCTVCWHLTSYWAAS
jgi:hypothetical protein